jgi:WD40 repeat protein
MARTNKSNRSSKPAIVPLEPAWRCLFEDFVHELAVSPDGSCLAVGGGAGIVALVDSAQGTMKASFESHFPGLCRLAFSLDSKWLGTVGHDGFAKVWSVETGDPVWKTKVASRGWAEHLCWLPDNRMVVAAGKALRILDDRGEAQYQLESEGTILGLALTQAPKLTLAIATYGGVVLLDLESQMATHQKWNGALIQPVWSPKGNHLAVGSQEGSVQIWQQSPQDRFEMSGYESKIQNISWDATGRYMATDGSTDCAVWDFSGKGPRGQKPLVHSAHRHLISAVAFRPVGIRFATGGLDGLLALWDLRRPVPGAATIRSSPVSRLVWTPDGSHLIAGFHDGHVASFPNPKEQFS